MILRKTILESSLDVNDSNETRMQVSGYDFIWCLKCSRDKDIRHEWVNPFDDGATFVRGTRLKKNVILVFIEKLLSFTIR